MARFLRKRTAKRGTAPGSLTFVGKQKMEEVRVELASYNAESLIEKTGLNSIKISEALNPDHVSWINVLGLHKIEVIEDFGKNFKLHSLLQEDVLNTTQRPKFEEFDDHLFIVVKMLHFNKESMELESEQLSLVFGRNFLISFQETPLDVFDPIRERLLRATTKIRQRSSDYLAFALLDALVDEYIIIIENFGEHIEALEDELLTKATEDHMHQINRYKKEMSFLSKTIRPARELISKYKRSDSDLIADATVPFLEDLEDHVTQATEAIELYKDMLNDQLNIYDASLNNRLNEIMRVLTIFSVVFIPLTFIAGIYGTNFEYFPEIKYRYAYPIFWIVLVIVALLMIRYFKKNRWL